MNSHGYISATLSLWFLFIQLEISDSIDNLKGVTLDNETAIVLNVKPKNQLSEFTPQMVTPSFNRKCESD